jgi:ABC-type transporter Mla MlaB component
MSVGTFQIVQPTPERVDITLRGSVTDAVLTNLLQQLKVRFASARDALVLFNLSEVTEVTPAGRVVLVQVQGFWKTRARRTAYVAEQARMRGLALYVVHASADGNARALSNSAQVAEWFQVAELRTDSARQRTLEHLAAARRILAEMGNNLAARGA